MKFGENLKNLRKIKKISQEKLAEKLGVSRQSVSKWETGEAYPEMKHILKICELFHCKMNDLVHDSLTDVSSLDEEIQENVVKFKEEKQIKVKKIAEFICNLSKVWKVIALVCLIISIGVLLVFPFLPNSFYITQEGVIYLQETYTFVDFNRWLLTDLGKVIGHIMMYIILLSSCFVCLFHYRFAKDLELFFNNIYHLMTPFVQDNIFLLKKMVLNITFIFILPFIETIFMDILKGGNHEWGSMDIFSFIFIFVLYAFVYIFEYGYEIQRDSLGVIYSQNVNTNTKVKKMNKKALVISVGIVLLAVCIYEALNVGYKKTYLDTDEKIMIQEEYNLNLESIEWKYIKYEKNTIINSKEPMILIRNPFVKIFELNSLVNGYVTHGDEFIDIALPYVSLDNEAMSKAVVEWKGIPITITQFVQNNGSAYELSNDYYLPYYQLDFKYNDNLYRFKIFINDKEILNGEDFFYKRSNTKIREEEIEYYLLLLDEIIILE